MSHPPTTDDLKIIERELQQHAHAIDRVLRKHYATHGLRRLLARVRSHDEIGRSVVLSVPSGWLIISSVLLLSLAYLSQHVPLVMRYVPPVHYAWVVGAILAMLLFERLLLPRMALVRHRFRLMRLEHEDGRGDFPHVYTVAHLTESVTGFALQSWRAARGIRPGDIVISVSDAQDRGLAIIPLRTEGRLPVVIWDRDLFQTDAFAPLPAAVRKLAHDFDHACDRHARHAERIERSRAVRSGQVLPKQVADPQRVWGDVALIEPVKARLMTLARLFDAGSASATRGLLLYGPPGTGKTLIARSFAESMQCTFFPLSLTDLKSGYIGQSGENVKQLWHKARGEPRAVIFIDECEGVFGRRGSVSSDHFVDEIVTAFLAQWDGFDRQTNVWVVGATNRRDLIDPAILSRFDEQLEIGLPDGAQRLRIFGHEWSRLGGNPALPAQTETLTQGMSGRELSNLAKRIAREAGTHLPLSDAVLASATTTMRKQGSTATDRAASWDTLVLPEHTLKELQTTAGLLRHADSFRKRGISVPRGLLLYGPPGTGKTQIARTLANETGLRFIAASTADIKQGFVGQSGQKVRELFERARESAPSLLFIDEIDIVAATRGHQSDVMQTEIIGQLLQEMDGVATHEQPVFVLAATNRIDQLDEAVLSRLPKRIEIGLPDSAGTRQLLTVLLAGKPLGFDLAHDAATLAARATGRSGRDLRSWVEAAEHRAVARAIDAGDPDSITLLLEDFPPLDASR